MLKGDDSHLKNKCIHSGNCLSKETEFFLFNALFFSNWRISAPAVLRWFPPRRRSARVCVSPSSGACLPQLSFLKMLYERGCLAIGTVVSSFKWGLICTLIHSYHTTKVTQYMGRTLTIATWGFAYFSIPF